MTDLIKRLERWYASQCDGEWEHSWGVYIDTLDNPGWRLEVDLEGKPLAQRPFQGVKRHRSESDWIECRVLDRYDAIRTDRVGGVHFEGNGGPGNLTELLAVFLDWAESNAVKNK